MRQLTFLLFTLVFSGSLLAEVPWVTQECDVEVRMLEHLIDVTRENLRDQEQLLGLIKTFKEARKQFAKNSNDKRQAAVMVQTAVVIHAFIREKRLEHLFEQDFIKEVAFFSQFGSNDA